MTKGDNRLSQRDWKQLRAAILATSDVCWLCGQPGADTVDHVVARVDGGAVMDPTNLRPAHGRKIPKSDTHPGCPGNYGRGTGSQLVTSRAW